MRRFPDDIDPDYPVATVYNTAGDPIDYVGHHEPARSYAARGYRVKVHTGHGDYTRDELQEAVDRELAAATVHR